MTSFFSTQTFSADNVTLTVAAGDTVAVSNAVAYTNSGHTGDTLANYGQLFSGSARAVYFSSGGGKVINYAGGDIRGYLDGINIVGPTASVNNAGHVEGLAQDGIYLSSTVQNASVHNSGFVSGYNVGVYVGSSAGKTSVVVNTASGVIKGGIYGIAVSTGALNLNNQGKVIGDLYMSATESDTINNHRQISGQTHLGNGADRFDGHDGVQGKIFGEYGNDVLIGGAKHDILNGGYDRDTLTGHRGSDYFDYDAVNESLVGNTRDFITDFKQSEHDRIDLRDVYGGMLTFRGTNGFTAEGQVRYVLHNKAGTAHDTTSVYVNVDTILNADMQIEVKGLVHFHAGDFFL